jgi:tRNA nucleotidyltransferase (CCA-adding enzyme)
VNARELLREQAPWLFAKELATCIVGSAALAEACRRADLPPPKVKDLDLSWALDVPRATELLRRHGILLPTTANNQARGTIAMRLPVGRIEVTTLRASAAGAPSEARIEADLAARDLTAGALAWELATDRLWDPHHGLDDWRARIVRAVGSPADRVREHPVRWLRFYRRAHEWGFQLDPKIRKLDADPRCLRELPAEAIAGELRAGLLRCASPGRLLLEWHEAGLLAVIAPELSLQFDGRPAGPVRHHPEVAQGLHLILALEWAQRRAADLDDDARLMLLLAVLCHDLGKNDTPPREWPRHPGHENRTQAIASLFTRLPSLGDQQARRLAETVCRLHLVVRDSTHLRAGTLVDLYDEWFRSKDFRADLFALAVGADAGGRLQREGEGERVAAKVSDDLQTLRAACESVDAARLKAECGEDLARFKALLHEARARSVARAFAAR